MSAHRDAVMIFFQQSAVVDRALPGPTCRKAGRHRDARISGRHRRDRDLVRRRRSSPPRSMVSTFAKRRRFRHGAGSADRLGPAPPYLRSVC